jgi:predicted DNA-binding protein
MSTQKTPRQPQGALPAGTNIRLEPETRARLEKIAKKHGLKKADLIRNAVAYKLPEWESTGVHFA